MEPEQLKRETEEWLAGLGTTSEEVAKTLIKMKIKGKPKRVWECPLSVALKEKTGQAWSVISGDSQTKIPGGWLEATHPPAVQSFVLDFDRGVYPKLLEKKPNS